MPKSLDEAISKVQRSEGAGKGAAIATLKKSGAIKQAGKHLQWAPGHPLKKSKGSKNYIDASGVKRV